MAELFFVVGASGVGKDSLLNFARQHLQADAPVVFAHRYITRQVELQGENHIALSTQEFARRAKRGCFAMQWQRHQTRYGIGVEIDQWLSLGLSVVINGSRAYLPQAASRYRELIPVLITAEYELLRRRLQNRGRESREEIEARLSLARSLDERTVHPRLQCITNSGRLEVAGNQLLDLIQGELDQACA
jgi:ribose 1,5-bisphosphokinase